MTSWKKIAAWVLVPLPQHFSVSSGRCIHDKRRFTSRISLGVALPDAPSSIFLHKSLTVLQIFGSSGTSTIVWTTRAIVTYNSGAKFCNCECYHRNRPALPYYTPQHGIRGSEAIERYDAVPRLKSVAMVAVWPLFGRCLTLPYLTLPYVTLPYVALPCLALPYLALPYLTLPYFTLPDSPPCQPFCRVGKQMDIEDPRSLSFLHLLSLLETVASPPDHIFVENVRGFEGSRAHQILLQASIW